MTAACLFAGTNQTAFTSGGVASYVQVANGGVTLTTTEAFANIKWQVDGTFSKFWINITSNATTGTTVIRPNVNSSTVNQVISVATILTGFFQDSTNTDTIAAGDNVNISIANGAGVGTIQLATYSMLFSATTNTTLRHAYVGRSGVDYVTASTTFFAPLASAFSTSDQGTVEARFQNYSGTAGTLANLYAYIDTNGRGTNSTIRSRRASANGNMAITVGAAGTGLFQDTSNTDTVLATNLLGYSITTGTGAGSLIPAEISSEFTTTNSKSLICYGLPTSGLTQPSALTRFVSVGGWGSASTPEATFQTKALAAFTASNLSIYLDSNGNNGTSSWTLRSNGADTALTVSIGAGVSGRLSDTTNNVSVALNDLINYEFTTGGSSGTIDFRTATITADYSPQSGGTSVPVVKNLSRVF